MNEHDFFWCPSFFWIPSDHLDGTGLGQALIGLWILLCTNHPICNGKRANAMNLYVVQVIYFRT